MAKIEWDKTGEHLYETGVSKGVLYLRDESGAYTNGVAWNGLTGVTESPSGAESTALYADDIKYLNLISAEEFGGTIEAYMYPDEFKECNGEASLVDGIVIGQQTRKTFGFCYRTAIGNDVQNTNYGYKLHLIYGAVAATSERAYATINDSPEAMTLSWEFSTTPVPVTVDGKDLKPTSVVTIDSTKFADEAGKAKLAALEAKLYGSADAEPTLPLPGEIYTLMSA